MTASKPVSLSRYLVDSGTNEDLAEVIMGLSSACWLTSIALKSIALDGKLGAAETTNVQGEVQKPLDLLANDYFTRALGQSDRVTAVLSEEVEEVTWFKEPVAGDYFVAFDPLDGSSNLDVGLSVGSIFSISQTRADGERAILQRGREVVCAGYAIYGPSTMVVLTLNGRVDGFTLNPEEDEYVLTHPKMMIPAAAAEFAINMSRQSHWGTPISTYIAGCVAGADGPRGKSFNMRWTASMVAEVHRILMRGGIFLYPMDAENEAHGGKLRLMYEAIPMAMIVEAAGGQATDGQVSILDLVPHDPHQRVGVVLGSCDEVAEVAACFAAA